MNKREIAEIKKQFKKDNNAITRICGCYVDAEKQIKTTLKEAFFALSEEEIFKYYEIFKKSLSGGIGKNLHNLEYGIQDEGEDSAHALLMKLRDEKLTDENGKLVYHNQFTGLRFTIDFETDICEKDYLVTEDMLKNGVKIRKGKKVFHKAILA